MATDFLNIMDITYKNECRQKVEKLPITANWIRENQFESDWLTWTNPPLPLVLFDPIVFFRTFAM